MLIGSLIFWGLIIAGIYFLTQKIKAGKLEASEGNTPWPVKAKKTLLNDKEQVVFHRLTEAFPDWIVLTQVALSQVVYITKTDKRGTMQNKIYRKVLDFVICRQDTSVVAVIELDGNSHDSPRRSKSDDTKNSALEAAGIKILRINTKELLNGQQLRDLVAAP